MKATLHHLFFPTREAPMKLLAWLLVWWIAVYVFVRIRTGADAIALLLPTFGCVRIGLLVIVKSCRRRWDIPKRKTIL